MRSMCSHDSRAALPCRLVQRLRKAPRARHKIALCFSPRRLLTRLQQTQEILTACFDYAVRAWCFACATRLGMSACCAALGTPWWSLRVVSGAVR